MKTVGKATVGLLVIMLSVGLISCGDSDEGNQTPVSVQPSGPDLSAPVKIIIGNLTDKTGVSANALSKIDIALKDLVRYSNEEGFIPGVELEVVEYDGQWDPSRSKPGYEWLKNKGADLIWTPMPPAVATLKPMVTADKFPLFAATANIPKEELEGGWAFSLGITPEYECYTLLDWIAQNDSDFPSGRPAKIGGASWEDGYSNIWFESAERYAEAHPDQFTWVRGYLNEFSFIWTEQIEGLKDCDYVFVPTPMHVFVEDYRNAGYDQAKFIGSDVTGAFLGFIDKAELWDEIDGMLFTRSSRWYNEESMIIDLTNRLLEENRPDDAESIRRMGSGYISQQQIYLLLQIIKDAVEEVGAENVDPQAIYDAATSFSFTLDDVEDFASFDETKRYAQNYYAIYEARDEGENLFRVDPEWLEQVLTP